MAAMSGILPLEQSGFSFALMCDSVGQKGLPVSRLFWFTEEQTERIKPFVPKERGVGRIDGCKVLSGIVYVIKNGLQWVDAPLNMDRTRRSIIGAGGGLKTACSNAALMNWPSPKLKTAMFL